MDRSGGDAVQNRYDAVLSALDAGVVVHAPSTEILDANERARTLLGLRDLEGRAVTDPAWVFLEPDGSPMPLERFPVMQVIATKRPVRDLTMTVRPPAGPDVCFEVNAVPLLDDAGELEQVVVTFIDITARRQAEALLAEQAQRLELVLSSSRLGIWDWNMLTGAGRSDARSAEIVGLPLEELEFLDIDTWTNLMHPDDRTTSQAHIDEHARGLTPYYDVEVRMRHSDGHWVWVHDRGRIVEWTADGRPLRMAGTHEDVSAAHRAAEELAAAEEESRLAFDRSSVATCLVANDGRLIRVNPAICELMGRSEEELLTISFLDLTHPDDVDLGADELRDLLVGRRPSLRLTKRYVSGTGRVIWGDVTVSAVWDADGNLRHRIAQIIDVTSEHRLRASLMEAERIAHLGGWQLDLATGHVTWSDELYALFGMTPDGPAPDYLEQERLFTPESWERLSAAVSHTRETGDPYELEVEIVRADGEHRWTEARARRSATRTAPSSSCTACPWTSPTARSRATSCRRWPPTIP
jgi:PAS domain S-box-containing protein